MPEYLAPGVYVEETSFRAKSIEGVGTSTTAFVGAARKGPVASRADSSPPPPPPELLTSFGDFVRIFGGLEPLDFAADEPNYLAHAVLNYFNEGGGRLYVVRVAQGPVAALARLAGVDDAAADRVVINARFPGSAGNGTITVREILSAASTKNLADASAGTLLRAKGAAPVEPASVAGSAAGPFAVHDGGVLRLVVKGVVVNVTFHGKATEAKGANDLADTVTLDDPSHTLTVTLNGVDQLVTLPNGDHTPQDLALALNTLLRGAYARLDGKKLVIGTDQLGFGGVVKVTKNDKFGFNADVEATATYDLATNNVPDLAAVTVPDLNKILNDPPIAGSVIAEDRGGRLVLSTSEKGEAASLAIADATDAVTVSEHNAFGLQPPVPGASPARGSNVRVFSKADDGSWKSADATVFVPPADPAAEAGSFISLTILVEDASGDSDIFDDLSVVESDTRYVGTILTEDPASRADALRRLVWFDIGASVDSLTLHAALFSGTDVSGDIATGLGAVHTLSGGGDGTEPLAGAPDQDGSYASAFEQLRGLEDVSIVAAPGYASYATVNYHAIQDLLIQHVENPRAYRIGVLDTPPGKTTGETRLERSRIDSHRVALYYPWVTVANPLARPGSTQPQEIDLPPSGFICGIYARNDVEKDVSKAPANEVVRSALRFESDVNFAQNQLLNPLGVNCLRFFPGRGYRVWGARTASSDPEWKYVNIRRYFIYLEASIDRGTQWAVFENNGPRLWQNIRETIEDFLYNEWVSNRLLGDTPKQAYFVRCDRSTMTQNDLDNGRLICLIGVAALKPAEFVIFRIGQKTADART
jgi:phage tail sheath protein FI